MHKNMTHGHTRVGMKQSGSYRSWSQMRGRCLLPSNPDYWRYGAVGVTIYEEWNDFRAFLRDMGERPKGKSLDRIDGTKGYSPSNCRWADASEQNKNKRSNHLIEYNGQILCVSDWAKLIGISKVTLGARLRRYGWSVKDAIETPVNLANRYLRHRNPS